MRLRREDSNRHSHRPWADCSVRKRPASTSVIFLWLACFSFALLFASGFNAFETPNIDVARTLATTGRISVDAQPASGLYTRAANGRFYSMHEPIVDIAAAPAAAGALALARVTPVPFRQGFDLLMTLTAAAAFATTIVLLGIVAAKLGVSARAATGRLLLLALGSQYLIYAGRLPDVSLAALVFAACLFAWMNAEEGARWGWLWTGLAAGFLAAVKINMATVCLMLFGLAATSAGTTKMTTTRIGRIIQFLIGAAPGFAIVLGWNYVRTSGWLHAPYPAENTAIMWSQLPLGLIGSLISPAKGVLVFTPILLLLPFAIARMSADRRHSRLLILVAGSLSLAMIVIAATPAWSSGGGWGVRFYVPWLPPLLMLLVAEPRVWSRPWRIAGAAALGAGALMNIAGLVTNFHYRQQLCGESPWAWHGANFCAVAALPSNLARAFGANIPDVVAPGASAVNIWLSNRLALWWFAIRSVGIPPLVSWLVAGVLVCAGLACWRWSAPARDSSLETNANR